MFNRIINWIYSKPIVVNTRMDCFLIRVKGTKRYVIPMPELSVMYGISTVDDPFDPKLLVDSMELKYIRSTLGRTHQLEVFKVPIHRSQFYQYPPGIVPNNKEV